MQPTSKDIKDLLDGNSSLGLTFASDLFIGRQPSTPDNCVTVADTPGGPPDLGLNVSQYYYPTVQISIRNNSYVTAMNIANNIMVFLHGRGNETVGDDSTYYTLIRCSSGPTPLGWDENERVNIVLNFECQKRPQ